MTEIVNPHKMTQNEASDFLKSLFKEINKWCRGGVNFGSENYKEEREKANHRKDRLTAQVLGNPQFFRNARCWMVDINGTGRASQCEEEDLQKALKDAEDPNDSVKKALEAQGPLVHAVHDFIRANNWNLTDSGGGVGGWHLGIHATSEEVPIILEKTYNEFQPSFEHKLVYFSVHSSTVILPRVTDP